jgi:hypothetical protein
MKTKEEIEKLARQHCNIKEDLIIDEEERYYKDFQKYDGYVEGYSQCQKDNKYTEEDIVKAFVASRMEERIVGMGGTRYEPKYTLDSYLELLKTQ